ncbi:Transmembrane amino acid transporter protein [Paragonimus heterotremus]|uniref:Transmembrane amino acid transporter protein n=1 Tax=Paragonimus heterotremus TaxID=100268 RepID=A0A8J4SLN1_9TREM|nr:Transmembrane amino acid transporter protein [Paragonimus heterotremus]
MSATDNTSNSRRSLNAQMKKFEQRNQRISEEGGDVHVTRKKFDYSSFSRVSRDNNRNKSTDSRTIPRALSLNIPTEVKPLSNLSISDSNDNPDDEEEGDLDMEEDDEQDAELSDHLSPLSNYSRSQNPNRQRVAASLGQTIMQSLQYPPSLSLITSIRSAYGLFQPRLSSSRMECIDSISETTRLNVTKKRRRQQEQQQQWSIYDNAERTTSEWIAGWNCLSMIQGVGLLAMPYACFYAGWLSLPAIVLITLISCYTGHLVGDCLYDVPVMASHGTTEWWMKRNRIRSTLASIANDVIPYGGNRFTSLVIFADMFGACVLYLLLIGQSAASLFGPLMNRQWPVGYWTVLASCIALPLIMFPRMNIIAWFSITAMIGLHCCVLIGITFCALQAHGSLTDGIYLPPPKLNCLPISLTIFVFSFCAHAALPGIEGALRRPEQYPRILKITFGISGAVKVVFGIFGSLVLGSHVTESIADSMNNRPGLHTAMNVCVIITMLFCIPLFFYILGEQIDTSVSTFVRRGFLSKRACLSIYTVWFISTRLACFTSILLVAVLVPRFAAIISFIGAISGSLLELIFPCIFHLYLFWSHLGVLSKLLRVIIALFGTCMSVIGVIASMKKMLYE